MDPTIQPPKKHTTQIVISAIVLVFGILLLLSLGVYTAQYVEQSDVDPSTISGISGSSYTLCQGGGLIFADFIYIIITVLGAIFLVRYITLDQDAKKNPLPTF
jgi:TRAP-type C4-dicarboxylate transport system permease small subunit